MDEIIEIESPEKVEPFRLKTEIEGKFYEFSCPQDSPLAHVFAALGQMKAWCEEHAKASEEKQAVAEEEIVESKPIEE